MSEPKFKIGQRVGIKTPTIFGLIETEGEVVRLTLHNLNLYIVALDGRTYSRKRPGEVFNESELEAI